MAEIDEAVLRFLDGEEEAFGRIVRSWEKKVFNLAWRMLGNREDAQDVVQETFLSVFRSVRGLRDPARFPTWLYRITLNHCHSRRRARSPEISLSDPALGPAESETGFAFELPAALPAGETVEILDMVRKALAGLSEDHRTAIVLKEYLGLSLEEVSNVMDCPLSTAKSRLYHGLREVQRNLKHLGIRS